MSAAVGLSAAPRSVVIVGGGIHGGAIAYFLKERFGIESTILEKAEQVAPAASGKSGGFLAREWGSGPTVELHQRSFDLHVELAKTLHVDSFRPVHVLSVQVGRKGATGVSWLDRVAATAPMEGAAAQVTPLELTEKLIAASGAEVRLGVCASGVRIESNRVTGVTLDDGSLLATDAVVVAAGPWSGVLLEDWFGVACPMQGVRSTSLVFRDAVGAERVTSEFAALFCSEDSNGCHVEVYPRPDGSLYLCGLGGSAYLAGDDLRPGGSVFQPGAVQADPARVAAGLRSFRSMSSLGDGEPVVTQACMRPLLPDGLPVMGAVTPDINGAFVSSAHNCWGILWAPASGLAMAELIATGSSKVVDLRPFSPGRFITSKPRRGRKQGEKDVGEQW